MKSKGAIIRTIWVDHGRVGIHLMDLDDPRCIPLVRDGGGFCQVDLEDDARLVEPGPSVRGTRILHEEHLVRRRVPCSE